MFNFIEDIFVQAQSHNVVQNVDFIYLLFCISFDELEEEKKEDVWKIPINHLTVIIKQHFAATAF